jgi:signal transduction histidine kinase
MNFQRSLKEITNLDFFKSKPAAQAGDSPLRLINYRLMWVTVVVLTSVVALLPLITITIADYKATETSIETEYILRTSRVVSNTYRSLAFLLGERKAALHFVAASSSVDELWNQERISELLTALRKSFGGGFVDIGIIDASGLQYSYKGPYALKGKDYSGQPWFDRVIRDGAYVSDVFLGFRQQPHLVIAVKKELADSSFQIIRTTMNIEPLDSLLANLHLGGRGDAFIINSAGILQNNSRYYGKVLSPSPLPVPEYWPSTNVIEYRDSEGKPLLIGYRFIDNTPFVLMVVKEKRELMKSWLRIKRNLIFFLFSSVCMIVLVTVGTVTVLVRRLYQADKQRLVSIQQIGHSEKMASIGRLAANVSHEINNPLAIINESAGLIKDLFELKKECEKDPKLIGLVESILVSVQRASKITRRLLTFSRKLEAGDETVDLYKLIKEVVGFLEKEAELKLIDIRVDAADGIPAIEADRGILQQIFINIINNSLDAMEKQGQLTVKIDRGTESNLVIKVCDTGCGIPQKNLPFIFEPFFSSKVGQGGTGLGLAVTYNLVREIGGRISVESRVGVGTCFTVTLPLSIKSRGNSQHAHITGR